VSGFLRLAGWIYRIFDWLYDYTQWEYYRSVNYGSYLYKRCVNGPGTQQAPNAGREAGGKGARN